jgi:hypothetical protein
MYGTNLPARIASAGAVAASGNVLLSSGAVIPADQMVTAGTPEYDQAVSQKRMERGSTLAAIAAALGLVAGFMVMRK